MQVHHSSEAIEQSPCPEISRALAEVVEVNLREIVRSVAIPRHFTVHNVDGYI
jgi:hypothetical protein